MLPHRQSFILALFTLTVGCAAVHVHAANHSAGASSTSSTFSPLSPAVVRPTPTAAAAQAPPPPPSQNFSSPPSSTLSSSLRTSSTPSSTSTIPPATPTTSSTTNTTPTETSTTTPSTASTSSTSTSSSSSQTPSPSSSTSPLRSSPTSLDVAPATTLIVPDPASFTTSTSSGDPGPTTDVSASSATSSTSFWDNKSAVAGTFVTIALASLVLVAVVAYMVFRRRQQRKLELAMEAEEFIDRGDIADPYDTRGVSPEPSMAEVTMPNRAEAIVSRDIHFGANYMEFSGRGTYGLDYPPAAVLNNANTRGPTYPAAGNVRHQPGVGSSAVGYLSPPSNSSQPGRESVATHISYDSFYGGIDKGYAI